MKCSISRAKLFKSCRRAYYFKYHEKLIPVERAEALETGSSYHELLEWINIHGSFDGIEEDYSKEQAMASAYLKYIYPHFKVKSVEEWKEKPIGSHVLIGRLDGVAEDGCIVEHKTTGMEITEQYEYNLLWDEQILAYMYLTGARKVYYTVCRKPTIRQKKDESDEEFYQRMVEWYDVDTDSKIRLLIVERTDEEVQEFADSFKALCDEMESTKNFYRCTNHCSAWGRRCEYSSICLNYDPSQQYIEFTKKED